MTYPIPFLSPSKWPTLVALALGAFVGWLMAPGIWLAFGPFRWLAFVLAASDQESSYNPAAAGDDGGSVGVLQFAASTWQVVSGGSDDADRTSAFLSGYYAPRMVEAAFDADSRWFWYLACPVLGYAAFRHLWTHGYGSADSLADAWSETSAEAASWSAFLAWRGLSLIPVLALLPFLLAPVAVWKRRG